MKRADQRLWRNFWHLICHRTEVAEPRDYVRLDVAGEEVVAFHDGLDVIVFNNLCPHRGARIFDGNAGNARFICQYHGWSFSRGKLFPADKQQFAHCPPEALHLPRFEARWVGDFLFASPEPIMSLEEQLSESLSLIERISTSIGGRDDFNTYEYDCEWQIAVENALEGYHVSVVHPDSLAKLGLEEGDFTFEGWNSTWHTEVDAGMRTKLSKLNRFFDLDYQHSGYMNVYLFPFTMLSSTFGFSYSVQHFTPSPIADRSHFASRLFRSKVRDGVNPSILKSFFASSAAINRQVFSEDNSICARVPARSWSPLPPTLYARSEERIVHFRDRFSTALHLSSASEEA